MKWITTALLGCMMIAPCSDAKSKVFFTLGHGVVSHWSDYQKYGLTVDYGIGFEKADDRAYIIKFGLYRFPSEWYPGNLDFIGSGFWTRVSHQYNLDFLLFTAETNYYVLLGPSCVLSYKYPYFSVPFTLGREVLHGEKVSVSVELCGRLDFVYFNTAYLNEGSAVASVCLKMR